MRSKIFIMCLLVLSNSLFAKRVYKKDFNDFKYLEQLMNSEKFAAKIKSIGFKEKLNLNDCLFFGLNSNIKLRDIRRSYELQNMKIDDSKITLYPNFSFTQTNSDSKLAKYEDKREYSISYDFDISQVKQNTLKLHRTDKMRIVFTYKKELLDTVLNVKLAYFNILLILENIKTYQNSIIQAKDFIKLSKKRKVLGLGIELDIMLNEANLKDKEYLLFKEKNSYKLAIENLKKLLKKKDLSDIKIDKKFVKNDAYSIENYNKLLKFALEHSVDLKLMEINHELLHDNKRIINGQQGVNFSFSSGRSYSGNNKHYDNKDSTYMLNFSKRFGYNGISADYSKSNSAQLGALKNRSFTIDLLKGRSNVVDKRENSHSRRNLKEQIADFKINIKYELKRLLYEIANIEKHLDSLKYNKKAYKLNLEKMKKKYKLGMIDINEVKDAEITYDNINHQINLEAFRYNINIAYLENMISHINLNI